MVSSGACTFEPADEGELDMDLHEAIWKQQSREMRDIRVWDGEFVPEAGSEATVENTVESLDIEAHECDESMVLG
jgi:hypothetical protein